MATSNPGPDFPLTHSFVLVKLQKSTELLPIYTGVNEIKIRPSKASLSCLLPAHTPLLLSDRIPHLVQLESWGCPCVQTRALLTKQFPTLQCKVSKFPPFPPAAAWHRSYRSQSSVPGMIPCKPFLSKVQVPPDEPPCSECCCKSQCAPRRLRCIYTRGTQSSSHLAVWVVVGSFDSGGAKCCATSVYTTPLS